MVVLLLDPPSEVEVADIAGSGRLRRWTYVGTLPVQGNDGVIYRDAQRLLDWVCSLHTSCPCTPCH